MVEPLGSTQAGRASANDEDIDVTVEDFVSQLYAGLSRSRTGSCAGLGVVLVGLGEHSRIYLHVGHGGGGKWAL